MASYAARIEAALGTRVEFAKGRRGQFDILVDGRVVVTRKGGLIAKFLRKPWPSEDDVVAAVRDAVPPPAS